MVKQFPFEKPPSLAAKLTRTLNEWLQALWTVRRKTRFLKDYLLQQGLLARIFQQKGALKISVFFDTLSPIHTERKQKLVVYYRRKRSCGKVMFLLSACYSVHRGERDVMMLLPVLHTPCTAYPPTLDNTPPWTPDTPGSRIPWTAPTTPR